MGSLRTRNDSLESCDRGRVGTGRDSTRRCVGWERSDCSYRKGPSVHPVLKGDVPGHSLVVYGRIKVYVKVDLFTSVVSQRESFANVSTVL